MVEGMFVAPWLSTSGDNTDSVKEVQIAAPGYDMLNTNVLNMFYLTSNSYRTVDHIKFSDDYI